MIKMENNIPREKIPSSILSKWGYSVLEEDGWTTVPNSLLMKQKELNLNNSELLLLIQILSFIHHADTEAYPSIATLSKRINQHPRTVQRTINSLEKKKILKKTIRSKSPKDVGKSNIYSVEPLIAKLQKMRQETI